MPILISIPTTSEDDTYYCTVYYQHFFSLNSHFPFIEFRYSEKKTFRDDKKYRRNNFIIKIVLALHKLRSSSLFFFFKLKIKTLYLSVCPFNKAESFYRLSLGVPSYGPNHGHRICTYTYMYLH